MEPCKTKCTDVIKTERERENAKETKKTKKSNVIAHGPGSEEWGRREIRELMQI